MQKLAYPIPEAAELIGVGYVKFYQLIGSGELDTFRVGRRRLCSAAAIERYIKRQEAVERQVRTGADKFETA
jgi:excisionase family DNA binding protein